MHTPASVRARFPGVCGTSTALLDHAGGSPLPACVIDAATQYMRRCFVQTGADYDLSKQAAAVVKAAHEFAATFLNAGADQRVVLGPSTTALAHLLANAVADAFAKGDLPKERDEIVVCSAGHEANVWPWARLADRGFTIRWWHATPDPTRTMRLDVAALRALVGPRTCIVAFPQVSNILGDVWDARALCEAARAAGARSVVDGVAYAPHRLPDVEAIGCDWYLYSTYKVNGPHMAVMAGRLDAFSPLTGPNHPFIARDDLPYKFELGGVSHESAAGIGALDTYMRQFIGADGTRDSRGVFTEAFRKIEAIEGELLECLLGKLRADDRVSVIGDPHVSPDRIAIVSFTVKGRTSESVARQLSERGMGVKRGDFYSRRLIERLGIPVDDGVVRISLAHYNTREEIERLKIS